MTIFAVLTILAGGLMIASKARRRFPCFAGGCAAIIAGGYTLCLPLMDSIGTFGWIWFCAWIAALPIMLACAVALVVIFRQDRTVLRSMILCGFAVGCTIPVVVSYWSAAGSGIVRIERKSKANKAVEATPISGFVEFLPPASEADWILAAFPVRLPGSPHF